MNIAPAPYWLRKLLWYKKSDKKKVEQVTGCRAAPNIADVDNATSLAISDHVFCSLGIIAGRDGTVEGGIGSSVGTLFEQAIRDDLGRNLPSSAPTRNWKVGCDDIKKFEQYQHLEGLQQLLTTQPNLRTMLGTDYQIRPDITVGVDTGVSSFLHGVVSCKWTLRSDRAQNIRHEFKLLIASRRGRSPHLVAATIEPFPGRLLSLTRGTGEIDAVYHLAYHELGAAIREHGTPEQLDAWQEMTEQRRLRSYADLVNDLTRT